MNQKWRWTSSINFFAASYLVEHRVEKAYKNFIESMYGINELNHHTFKFQDVFELPLPLFQDYIDYQLTEKKKAAEKQKRESQKVINKTKI